MHTRRAKLQDVNAIHRIINQYTSDNTLLPRGYAELCENVRDFIVVEDENDIVACGALHLYGTHLTELRSIAVDRTRRGAGAGDLLISALLEEAEWHGVRCVCLFTRIPDYFARFGFSVAVKEDLPDKIYKDCQRCPRQNACDEIAMFRGELPRFAILPPAQNVLALPILHYPS
ncbi:MAG TPA: N-acetyltransferase [Terriglobales bacterium]|jgi:amino-acid N-acetyltransferase